MPISIKTTTENAILLAAENLFLSKGFASTSTTEIAREVGCNQAMVHYYFRTKERLFEAIFEKKVRMLASELVQISNEDIPFEEKLRKKVESHFEMIEQNPRLPFLFFSEMNSNPNRLASIREKLADLPREAIQLFEKELSDEIDKGNVRPMEIHDLLMTMISLNMTLFLAEPLFKTITNISDEDYVNLVKRRKKDNVEIILKSIKP